MARTKQTARKSTGGPPPKPRHKLATSKRNDFQAILQPNGAIKLTASSDNREEVEILSDTEEVSDLNSPEDKHDEDIKEMVTEAGTSATTSKESPLPHKELLIDSPTTKKNIKMVDRKRERDRRSSSIERNDLPTKIQKGDVVKEVIKVKEYARKSTGQPLRQHRQQNRGGSIGRTDLPTKIQKGELSTEVIKESESMLDIKICTETLSTSKILKLTIDKVDDVVNDEEHPKNLIPELLRLFYTHDWVNGTGGGISMRIKEEIYISPSGVQKEPVKTEDMFIQKLDGSSVFEPAAWKNLKPSQFAVLFRNAYLMRDASVVISSFSKNCIMASLLYPGKEFRITHQEMIKRIQKCNTAVDYRYDEELVIPIIENSPDEENFQESISNAMRDYPEASAVLVRRHGIYVWGKTWQQAKSMCEAFDYLCEIAVLMKTHGMDPELVPK